MKSQQNDGMRRMNSITKLIYPKNIKFDFTIIMQQKNSDDERKEFIDWMLMNYCYYCGAETKDKVCYCRRDE